MKTLTFPIAFANAPQLVKSVPRAATEILDAMETYDGDELLKRSSDSAAMLDYWDKSDVIVEGAKAVREQGEKYLPKFVEETSDEFSYRLSLSKFTNIYRDIIESLAAKPFEEEISLPDTDDVTIPPDIEAFIEDVDGSGNNLTMFGSLTFFNGINSAIDWIYIDYPKANPNIKTLADQKAAGLRPFWSHVLGRNVLEARIEMIAGKETLVYMRILEPGEPDHVRVFERDITTGFVNWTLYVKTEKMIGNKTQFAIEDQGTISIGIIPLVPFITGRRDGRRFKVFPPMQDAADLQIELYQQESGLKFIKTLAAYPMLSGVGITPELMADGKTPKKMRVKPMAVLYSKANQGGGSAGEFKFIEPAATSMKFLADDVKATIEQLRELGRQPLTAQSGNLTVITTAVAAGKAKSAVGAWALALKDALENAMVITCLWMNIRKETYDPEINVYTEFDDVLDDGKDLDTLNKARAAGDLSQPTYWLELKRRKVLSPEFDAEEETKALADEMPVDPLNSNLDENGNPLDKNGNPIKKPEPQPGNVA